MSLLPYPPNYHIRALTHNMQAHQAVCEEYHRWVLGDLEEPVVEDPSRIKSFSSSTGKSGISKLPVQLRETQRQALDVIMQAGVMCKQQTRMVTAGVS